MPGLGSAAAVLAGKRAFPKLEEKVGQLERACRVKGRLKAGSEMNLLALGKSLKGHIAATASSAASEVGDTGESVKYGEREVWRAPLTLSPLFFPQGSFLRPLLKRTTSARSALRPPPSPVTVGKGNVMRKTKVTPGFGEVGRVWVIPRHREMRD